MPLFPAVPLNVASGGTGLATLTAHDLLIGNGTGALTLLAPSATAGVPLVSAGSSADPAYGQLDLSSSSAVKNTLAVGNGGTGQASNWTAEGLIYASSTTVLSSTAAGSIGQLIQSNGSGSAPTYSGPCIVSYYRGGGTFSSGTNAISGISTLVVDTDSAFSSSQFTTPFNYTVNWLVTLTIEYSPQGTGQYLFGRIYKNGSQYIGLNACGASGLASGNTSVISGSMIVQTTVNTDTITFETVASTSTTFTSVLITIQQLR